MLEQVWGGYCTKYLLAIIFCTKIIYLSLQSHKTINVVVSAGG